jgi:hypothetical protein
MSNNHSRNTLYWCVEAHIVREDLKRKRRKGGNPVATLERGCHHDPIDGQILAFSPRTGRPWPHCDEPQDLRYWNGDNQQPAAELDIASLDSSFRLFSHQCRCCLRGGRKPPSFQIDFTTKKGGFAYVNFDWSLRWATSRSSERERMGT